MKHRFAGGSTFLISLLITGFCGAGDIARCDSLDIIPTPITEPPGNFGTAVQASGDYLFVRRSPDFPGPNISRIFVYRFGRAGWELHQELLPGGPATEAMEFGWQFAASGEHAFVSAPMDDEAATNAGAVYHYRLIGDMWELQKKILPPVIDAGSQFGTGLAYDGQRLVVGAPWADLLSPLPVDDIGAAYSFVWIGGALVYEATIAPFTFLRFGLAPGDQFGTGVAVDGDAVMIGAPMDDELGDYAGAVYVFHHGASGWIEEQKLLPEGVPSGELGITQFGRDLQLKGDWAMAAQPFSSVQAGRVVPFKREGGRWTMQPLLAAPVPIAYVKFGTGVALEDDLMLIGAGSMFMPSACYVYGLQAGQWVMVQEMPAIDTQSGSQFGAAVALQGQTAYVGAPRSSVGTQYSGAVFVFDAVPFDDCNFNSIEDGCEIESASVDDADVDGVPDECELICPVGLADVLSARGVPEPASDSFGNAVAIDGDVAVVGGSLYDGPSSGIVAVYRWNGIDWDPEQVIAPPEPGPLPHFGGSVAVSDDRIVIAASGTTWPTVAAGAAYVYRFDGLQWQLEQKLVSAGIGPQPFFAADVDAHDGRIAVGNSIGTIVAASSGVVEIFELVGATWTHMQTFTAPAQPSGSGFGSSLDLSAQRMIVGAPYLDGGGGAYVFRRDASSWVFEQQLLSLSGPVGPYFGSHSAIDNNGDTVLVGTRVFKRSGVTWIEQQKLEPQFVMIPQGFGGSSALGENVALVGDNSDAPVSKAYLFAFDGIEWKQRRVFSADDSTVTTDAELRVALDGDRVLIGAVLSETAAMSGAVVFAASVMLADLNCSGDVDGFDLATLLGSWGPCVPGSGCPADLNGDDLVNGFDLALLLGAWS